MNVNWFNKDLESLPDTLREQKIHYTNYQAIGVAQRIFDGKRPWTYEEYEKINPIKKINPT